MSPLYGFVFVVLPLHRLIPPLHFTFSFLIICDTNPGETYTQLDQTDFFYNIILI